MPSSVSPYAHARAHNKPYCCTFGGLHYTTTRSALPNVAGQRIKAMAPKKSKKELAAGSSKKKKAKPGLDGQKPKKGEKAPSRKNKAWGKSKVKNRDDGDGSAGGARSGLKPVRIKLDKEGRDVILDILHKLHVAGAGDGAEDDTDGSDEDEDDEEDEEEGSSDEDSEDASEADVEVDDSDGGGGDDEDFVDRRGHGDFEYDGSFGEMANLMSDLVVNEAALPAAAEPASSSGKGLGEEAHLASAGPAKSGSGSSKINSPPTTAAKKRQEQEQIKNPLLGGSSGGSSSSASKGAARSNVTREKLLASMVQEDRKTSREAQRGVGAVPSAAIHAASTVGGGAVSGAAAARGYQRPDPPGAGKGSDKVRLEVCGENKKTGAPDLNGKKVRSSLVAFASVSRILLLRLLALALSARKVCFLVLLVLVLRFLCQ